MRELSFFDSNCRIGTPMNAMTEYAPDSKALCAEMDRNGVEKALIRPINSGAAGAVYSNQRITEILQEDEARRLTGVWTILPEQCPELPSGKEFFLQMKQNRIGALTMFPAEHRWVVSRLTIGRFMDEAAERRIPILVSLGTISDGYYHLAECFPRNTYIIHTTGLWGADRVLRPLLGAFEGIHVEVSEYWVPEGIAELVKRYGEKRILYGSGYPRTGFGSMMLAIKHADIPESTKKAIAGGNLERLITEAEL